MNYFIENFGPIVGGLMLLALMEFGLYLLAVIVIAVATYFFLRWLIRNEIRKSWRRR